jgi:hypothetical protein
MEQIRIRGCTLDDIDDVIAWSDSGNRKTSPMATSTL